MDYFTTILLTQGGRRQDPQSDQVLQVAQTVQPATSLPAAEEPATK